MAIMQTLRNAVDGMFPQAEPGTPHSGSGDAFLFVEEKDIFDSYRYRLKRVLHQGRTAFQSVLIAETCNYGLALFLDGVLQSAEDDEAIYHELLVQPAMLRHPEPRDVLILGGGEGATLREVLVHRSVRSATMIDIDRELVELCRQHLPTWHRGAFEDPRARVIHGDGRALVENDNALYDVIIVDLIDAIEDGIAQALYTREFYMALRRRLRPGGIIVIQALEFSFLDDKPHAALVRTIRTVLSEVYSYRVPVPSFLSSWGFIIASDWAQPPQWSETDIDIAIRSRLGDWLSHLDGAFLKACFTHCKETQRALARPGPIIEDGAPFRPPPEVFEVDPSLMKFPYLQD